MLDGEKGLGDDVGGDEDTGFRAKRCEYGPRGIICGRPSHL